MATPGNALTVSTQELSSRYQLENAAPKERCAGVTSARGNNADRELWLYSVREHYYDSIADEITNSADMSYAEIGRMVGCSENLVWNVARLRGLSRTAKPMSGDKEPGSTKCQ